MIFIKQISDHLKKLRQIWFMNSLRVVEPLRRLLLARAEIHAAILIAAKPPIRTDS